MKKVSLVLLIALVFTSFTGCYWKKEVSGQQVGLVMDDGVSITEVVGPGRYSRSGIYSDITMINVSTKTSIWSDNDVWTKDKQVVSFGASISYARKSDSESIRGMWATYNLEAKDDDALDRLVMSRLPRVAKQITTTYTLDQMLGIDENSVKNRDSLQKEIEDALREVLAECYIELIDLGVNNIGVDDAYAAKLKEKSTAAIDVELAKERTRQAQEKLNEEKAQTEVDLEIARRNNMVAEEEAKVFSLSPEAYELERLKLLKDVIGRSDKIYFIPEGADISLYLSGGNNAPIITEKSDD